MWELIQPRPMIITLTIQLLTANINWRVSVKYRQMLEAEATTNYHYYKAIEQIAQLNCTYSHLVSWDEAVFFIHVCFHLSDCRSAFQFDFFITPIVFLLRLKWASEWMSKYWLERASNWQTNRQFGKYLTYRSIMHNENMASTLLNTKTVIANYCRRRYFHWNRITWCLHNLASFKHLSEHVQTV